MGMGELEVYQNDFEAQVRSRLWPDGAGLIPECAGSSWKIHLHSTLAKHNAGCRRTVCPTTWSRCPAGLCAALLCLTVT